MFLQNFIAVTVAVSDRMEVFIGEKKTTKATNKQTKPNGIENYFILFYRWVKQQF